MVIKFVKSWKSLLNSMIHTWKNLLKKLKKIKPSSKRADFMVKRYNNNRMISISLTYIMNINSLKPLFREFNVHICTLLYFIYFTYILHIPHIKLYIYFAHTFTLTFTYFSHTFTYFFFHILFHTTHFYI